MATMWLQGHMDTARTATRPLSYARARLAGGYARALSYANIHWVNPPSYVGNSNASYIDHICVPVEMVGCIERYNVLCEAGRRLQLHDVGEVRDHRPVQLVDFPKELHDLIAKR
eukprot:5039022-Pyramimonas_sp.AAC.1